MKSELDAGEAVDDPPNQPLALDEVLIRVYRWSPAPIQRASSLK